MLPEIFICVAERDRARARNSQKETRKIRSTGASERERSTSILLRQHVELLPSAVDAECHIVAPTVPETVVRHDDVLRPVVRRLYVTQSGGPARKHQRRRTPVLRILVVTGNSRNARNIQSI